MRISSFGWRNTDKAVAGTKKLLLPLFQADDLFLAFLPLAHILEMVRLVRLAFDLLTIVSSSSSHFT